MIDKLAPSFQADLGQPGGGLSIKPIGIEASLADQSQRDVDPAVAQLAAAVAHAFNNLLTTILGYAELGLEELPERHPVRETLVEIRLAGQSAASLTQRLLVAGGHVRTTGGEAGDGTTVRLSTAGAASERQPREATTDLRSRHEEGSTILLVEDEEGVRTLARKILERNGYGVLEAAGGREALEIAEKHTGRIDLLLTDVVMPDLNGRDVAQRIGALRPRTPCVFMSGYSEEVLGVGTALLHKPFTPAALLRIVEQALQQP
jgi:CheY-like chemotaxis protein